MKRYHFIAAIAGVLFCLGIAGLIFAAEKKHSISLEAPPHAQILQIDYYLKVIKQLAGGKPAMHFEVRIKNLSGKGERFSVMVSTPDGASTAGFIPAKAKKPGELPLLEPGEEGKITLPLLTDQMAESFSVVVESVPAG